MAADDTTVDDRQLLERIVQRDHQAFAMLVRRHSERFYRIAFRMLAQRDEAEAMVQDAFLKLWEKPSAYNPSKGAAFTTWFYRVVVNVCQDYLKKKRPGALPETMEVVDGADDPEATVVAMYEYDVLERAIGELPSRQKLALNLCFYEGVSQKQAAEIMGVKIKALESLLMRAKEGLRTRLAPLLSEGKDDERNTGQV